MHSTELQSTYLSQYVEASPYSPELRTLFINQNYKKVVGHQRHTTLGIQETE